MNEAARRRYNRKAKAAERGSRVSHATLKEDAEIVAAWEAGALTEGQAASALGVDRLAARLCRERVIARGVEFAAALKTAGLLLLALLCSSCSAWQSVPQADRTLIIRVIADGALRAAGVEGAQPAKPVEVEMTPEELLAFLATGARTPEDVVAIAHLAGALRTTDLMPGGVPPVPLAEDAASSQRPPIREGEPSCACGIELPRQLVDTLFRSPGWIEVPNGDRRLEALQRQAALTALGDWLVAHPLCSARPGDFRP